MGFFLPSTREENRAGKGCGERRTDVKGKEKEWFEDHLRVSGCVESEREMKQKKRR